MAKRKVENLTEAPPANGSKKAKHNTTPESSKPSLLDDNDSASSSDDDSVGGAKLEQPDFKINEEYAKRFEHNKKREELHKCSYSAHQYKFVLSPSSGGEIPKAGEVYKRSIWRQI
jgi:protein KRI1